MVRRGRLMHLLLHMLLLMFCCGIFGWSLVFSSAVMVQSGRYLLTRTTVGRSCRRRLRPLRGTGRHIVSLVGRTKGVATVADYVAPSPATSR